MMPTLKGLLLLACTTTATAALVNDTTLLTHVPMIMVRGCHPLSFPR